MIGTPQSTTTILPFCFFFSSIYNRQTWQRRWIWPSLISDDAGSSNSSEGLMQGIRFVDLRGILSSWWTRVALKATPVVLTLKMTLLPSQLFLSLYLSIYLSLWRWLAVWWSSGLLTNGREKGGGGEWLPAAAMMVVWGCLDVGIADICLGCLGIAKSMMMCYF